MCIHTYIAIIENLQDSPNVNEPPTLPEVTTGSTVGEEDGTSINEGNYICMHTCIHAYMHTRFIQVEVIPLVKMFVAVMEGSKLLDVLELSWMI